ncbi:Uncharacterised protein [Mycobacteroides abscessus subsp. abscessus]|nr:Uncharacterised protein [Mycobacteroides abscessus subsp. abscessus]
MYMLIIITWLTNWQYKEVIAMGLLIIPSCPNCNKNGLHSHLNKSIRTLLNTCSC